MEVTKTIPILRIFNVQKAKEFYIDWLEFVIDWEHTFESNSPVYIQISKKGVVIHLSEHHGDSTPGAKIFFWCTGLKEYHQMLTEKKYKYNRPGLKETFYDAWCMNVIDPFGNQLSFNEK